ELAGMDIQGDIMQHGSRQLAVAVGPADAFEADQGSAHQNLGRRGLRSAGAELLPPAMTISSSSSSPSSTSPLTRVMVSTLMTRCCGSPFSSTWTRKRWSAPAPGRCSIGLSANTGMFSILSAADLTKNTWTLICGSSLQSGLGT